MKGQGDGPPPPTLRGRAGMGALYWASGVGRVFYTPPHLGGLVRGPHGEAPKKGLHWRGVGFRAGLWDEGLARSVIFYFIFSQWVLWFIIIEGL